MHLLSIHQPTQKDIRFLIALAVLCGTIFFYGLGKLPLLGPDEPRYAEVAREMYESRDWITPRLGGIKWFEKPALTYWLSAIGYSLFGVTEFAARFGIAVAASVGVALLYGFGKRIRSARYGYLSAAVLATCGMWPGFARAATFDLPLTVALTLALLSFFTWAREQESSGRNLWWWVFCVALGVGMLAKGLVGVVLPLAILVPYLILTRQVRVVLKPGLLVFGSLLVLATAAIWYGPMLARHGREFIDEFFIAHHFQRYLTNKYRHPQPVYFFPLTVLAGSFPWTFCLMAGTWRAIGRWRETLADRWRLFLWLWVLVPLVFFSFSGSKLPGYILPVFPAAALLIGEELERWWDDVRWHWPLGLTGFLVIAVGIAAGFVGQRDLRMSSAQAWTMATVTILVGVVYMIGLIWRGARAAMLGLPFGLIVVLVAAVPLVFPNLGQRESLRDLSLQAVQQALPGERLIFFVNPDHGINFYATDLPLRDTKSELVALTSIEQIVLLVQASRSQSLLIASPTRWSEGLTNAAQLDAQLIGKQDRHARCSPECDWGLLRVRRKN